MNLFAQDEPVADDQSAGGMFSAPTSTSGSASATGTEATGTPGTGFGIEGDPDSTAVPFDGGITLLLAAGAGYGLKRIRDEKRKRSIVKTD